MTDHLPECPWPNRRKIKGSCRCICSALRACEARKDAEHANCRCNELEAMAIVDGKYESVAINGQLLERRDVVLQEAHDAVAALSIDRAVWLLRHEALAAIDALRGEA